MLLRNKLNLIIFNFNVYFKIFTIATDFPLGPGKICWGHGAGAKYHGANTFFNTLKHGVDTFSQSPATGRILFSTTLKPKRLFTDKCSCS